MVTMNESQTGKRSAETHPHPQRKRKRSRFAKLSEPSPPTTSAQPENDAIPRGSVPTKNPAAYVALKARIAEINARASRENGIGPHGRLASSSQLHVQSQQQERTATNNSRASRSRFSSAAAAPFDSVSGKHAELAPLTPPPPASVDVTAIPVAPVSTLQINKSVAQEKRLRTAMKVASKDLLDTDPVSNPYFDPLISMNNETRRPVRTGFNFVKTGAIIQRTEKLRSRLEEEAIKREYQQKIAQRAAENSAVPELPPFLNNRQPYAESVDIPHVEWWDIPFLKKAAYFERDSVAENFEDMMKKDLAIDTIVDTLGLEIALRESRITALIHHPKRIAPVQEEKPPPVLPLMLTEKERKRLRRQKRMEKTREEREKIAVGLIPPPPPKVKLSNIMRVLTQEASADPTKIESEVRAQVEARRNKHEEDNEARRLTKEEKREKQNKKSEQDRASGLVASVYRLTSAENAQHRFKVDMNARQLDLSGVLLMYEDCNVVVVEGGAKALRKFKQLMLRRIDWSVVPDGNENAEENGTGNRDQNSASAKPGRRHECVLVWEGPILKEAFQEFKTVSIRTENGCRSYLRRKRVEHYWDLCIQASPPGDTSLGVRSID